MQGSKLEDVTRMVIQAVSDRLGNSEPQVVELVVREVVAAMASGVPVSSTPPPPARDNGDGTITTSLGSVLPHPAEGQSLELCAHCVEQQRRQASNRAVVTTTGRNCKGVVATMAAQIAEAGGDIQDISQTIISDYFTMIMVVDISDLQLPFSEFKERMLAAANRMGIHTVVVHEDVMRSLQRV